MLYNNIFALDLFVFNGIKSDRIISVPNNTYCYRVNVIGDFFYREVYKLDKVIDEGCLDLILAISGGISPQRCCVRKQRSDQKYPNVSFSFYYSIPFMHFCFYAMLAKTCM